MTTAPAPATHFVQPTSLDDPLPHVRTTVRALLLQSPAYHELDPQRRRELATAMVRVCLAAASLIREEIESGQAAHAAAQAAPEQPQDTLRPAEQPLAMAQTAGSEFSGVAADRVASTTHAILNAVSFPRFVTELINGVFKAIVDSNMQQMNSYVELLNNVAASTEGFADTNFGPDRARAWLAERYPASFEIAGDIDEDEPLDPESPSERTLRLRPGASMPSPAALRADLGLSDDDSVPTGDPDRVLVPLARRRLAQTRQEMLATMVMLGMQRIVVESGRINAAMRFHIDTRSAANADQGSVFNLQNQISASGSFGYGPWGASAAISNTIGYVSTQRSQTTEEMNTDLELTSSVEINFKSDYLPLNRLATNDQAARIRERSRNPEAEDARAAEEARRERTSTDDRERRQSLDNILRQPPAQPPRTDVSSRSEGGRGSASARAGSGSDAGSGGSGGSGSGNQPRPAAGGAGGSGGAGSGGSGSGGAGAGGGAAGGAGSAGGSGSSGAAGGAGSAGVGGSGGGGNTVARGTSPAG